MAYQLPDVFISVEFPDIVPTIQVPSLLPCMVGEHYTIEKDKFLVNNADVTTGAPVNFLYPGIPQSYNKDSDAYLLLVDVESGSAYKPTAYLVTQDGGTVDVTSDLTFTAGLIQVPVGMAAGAIYVSYRYRSDEYSGLNLTLLEASSISDLVGLFGANSISPANPLGYAMFCALTHGGVSVGGCAIGSPPNEVGVGVYSATLNTTLCYAYVADFLKRQNIHSITLLTTSTMVMNIFRSHVRDMSSELGKSERRLFFSPSIGGSTTPVRGGTISDIFYGFTIAAGVHGTPIAALNAGESYDFGPYTVYKTSAGIFVNYPDLPGAVDPSVDGEDITHAGGRLIDLGSSVLSPAATQVKVTDKISLLAWDPGLVTLDIVINAVAPNGLENMVYMTSGRAVTLGTFSIVRTVNPVSARNSWVAALKQFPRSYSDDRLTLVGPSFVWDPDTQQDVPSYFAAAKLAGEISRVGVAPAGASPGVDPLGFENSRTNTFFSSRYFTEEEMREIGGSGWTMLVNRAKGQQLTTQHTVTTNMSAPEYYELILGVERDFLAIFYRQELRKILRKFRVDDATLADISMTCGTIANSLYSSGSVSRCFKDVRVLSVNQNPLQRDQVLIDLEVTHLYPLNTIKVRVQVVA